MSGSDPQIDFTVSAVLKKWPSKSNGRAKDGAWPNPYTVTDGTLDECIQKFLELPAGGRHLYEIHTAPQGELVTAVMTGEHISEISRLRDFLQKQTPVEGSTGAAGCARVGIVTGLR